VRPAATFAVSATVIPATSSEPLYGPAVTPSNVTVNCTLAPAFTAIGAAALIENPAPLTESTVTVCVWLVVLRTPNSTASGRFGYTDPKLNCVPTGSSALPDT